MKKYSLGIDTSNYKTSVALVDNEGGIFFDDRIFLTVKDGELGLRQNEAVFQHIRNLPPLIEDALSYIDSKDIDVISVSDKPRNVDGSYMPCFTVGTSVAKILAANNKIPLVKCSHQEGHIEAAKRFTPLKDSNDFVAFHFSGGTTEALRWCEGEIDIIGGTKDISFGQLIDRVGVAMGYHFPAGEELDNGAIRFGSGNAIYEDGKRIGSNDYKTSRDASNKLPITKIDSSYINLSGLETAALRLYGDCSDFSRDEFSYLIMTEIGRIILSMMDRIFEETKVKEFLFAGGVSSSSFIRNIIEDEGRKKDYGVHFASPELASDNAVGVAFIGGNQVWR